MRRSLLWLVICIALTNLLSAFMASLYYGGVPEPIFGHPPTHGPYFLNANGHLTEVSRSVFTVLLWQGRSIIFTSVSGALCYWLLRPDKAHSLRP